MKRRLASLLLAFALLISAVPAVRATEILLETVPTEPIVQETVPETQAAQETTAPEIPTEETIPETTLPEETVETLPPETVPVQTIPVETEVLETEPALLAAVASGTCGSYATWELSATGVLTISGKGYVYGGNFRDYAEDIKTVTIQSGITGLGEGAFKNCKNMTKITIPNTVTSLGAYVFYGCESLTGITLPSGLKDLGYDTFYNCKSLTKITIPEGITEIGIYTFYSCSNLKTVTLPSTIEHIKSSAFAHCYALSGITLYQGLKTLGDGAFMCCDALKSVTLPNTLTAIPKDAFRQCENLTRVTIPSSVTSIGENAFTYTALTEVSIPASVTDISEEAFCECPNIKKFTVNTSNPSYCSDSYGVMYTKDKTTLVHAPAKLSGSYYIPGTVTTIAHGAFENCTGMTSVSIPQSVRTIKNSAFNSCSSLTSLTFPEGITEMADYVLGGCTKLKAFTIPQSVTKIGTSAFHGCESLTELVIPEGATTIKDYAFMRCKGLESIELPEGLAKIPDLAFTECSSLKTITIPASVTRIGYMALRKCTSLESVTFLGDAPAISSDAFGNVTTTAYYPAGNATWTEDKLQNYGGTITWVPYSEEHVHKFDETTHACTCGVYGGSCGENASWLLEEGTLTISGTGAMKHYGLGYAPWNSLTVKKLVVEEGITVLGKYAFYMLKDLADVTMADSVTEIGTSAFSNCDALKTIRLSASLKSIGDSAFMHCIGLTTITLPESLTKIGQMAFWSCENLAAIVIPNAVTDLGNHTFAGCSVLGKVTLPEGLTVLEAGVFAHCKALTTIALPQTLTKIGESAFSSAGLTEVTIPASVTSMETNAFNDCTLLKTITFEGNAPSFGAETFIYTTAEARYPVDNDTWTDDVKQNYGGTITWVPYCPGHAYADATCIAPRTCTICGETEGEALGHSFTNYVSNDDATCTVDGTKTAKCDRCEETDTIADPGSAKGHTEVIDEAVAATCQKTGLTEGKHCDVCKDVLVQQEVIPVTDHVYENGSCIYCKDPQMVDSVMTRISGSGRCQTAIEAAKKLRVLLGDTRFNAIVVADGDNYPDALSGSYLAAVAEAPILLVQKENAGSQTSVLNFIKYNLNLSRGTVYILGGKNSVSEEFENSIASYAGNNVKVVRLAGSGRYATSLKIIQEADKLQGKKSNRILVCDGSGYADSLSASATGLPVLLVNGKNTTLTAAQESYLKSVPNADIFVIGGKNSVSEEIRLALNKLDADGNAKRLSGSGREQTSVAVAKEFFPNPTFVVLADGNNYPDGLSGGPLAYAKKAPLILIREGREAAAKSYIADRAKEGYILGGKNSVSDTSVKNIFGANCLIQ